MTLMTVTRLFNVDFPTPPRPPANPPSPPTKAETQTRKTEKKNIKRGKLSKSSASTQTSYFFSAAEPSSSLPEKNLLLLPTPSFFLLSLSLCAFKTVGEGGKERVETCSDAAQLLPQLPISSSKKVWREANFADSFAKPIKSGKCQGSHFPMIGESCEIVVGEIPLFAGGITQSAPPFSPSISSSKGGGSSWLFPTKLFPSIIFLLPLPFFSRTNHFCLSCSCVLTMVLLLVETMVLEL